MELASILIGAILTIIPGGDHPTPWDWILHTDRLEIIDTYRPDPPPVRQVVAVRPPRPLPPADVHELIGRYFAEPDREWALRVSYCESRWNPNAKNPTSTASGLFQHLATYWNDRSSRAGWDGASIWDPEANVAVAAWLYYTGGPGHWICK